jgi:seryl-tRNA synthetase
MLDITLFRADQGGNPDLVRESQRRRYADVTLVDKVIELDTQWRQSEHAPSAFNRIAFASSMTNLTTLCAGRSDALAHARR